MSLLYLHVQCVQGCVYLFYCYASQFHGESRSQRRCKIVAELNWVPRKLDFEKLFAVTQSQLELKLSAANAIIYSVKLHRIHQRQRDILHVHNMSAQVSFEDTRKQETITGRGDARLDHVQCNVTSIFTHSLYWKRSIFIKCHNSYIHM